MTRQANRGTGKKKTPRRKRRYRVGTGFSLNLLVVCQRFRKSELGWNLGWGVDVQVEIRRWNRVLLTLVLLPTSSFRFNLRPLFCQKLKDFRRLVPGNGFRFSQRSHQTSKEWQSSEGQIGAAIVDSNLFV